MDTIAPAQLFIVPGSHTQQVVIDYLQKLFCTNNFCQRCATCLNIKEKQHHSVLWIEPEKRYTLDLLEPIIKKTELSLDQEQQYFFVLTKADFLTLACANSLLKIIEEPPPGYHFIFTAQRKQLILPTIQSRCTTQFFSFKNSTQETYPFSKHFMSLDTDPHAFLKELGIQKITEIESIELLNTFLDYWCTHYKKIITTDNPDAIARTKSMIKVLENGLLTPPMPGSTKIFWRNLFLQKSLV